MSIFKFILKTLLYNNFNKIYNKIELNFNNFNIFFFLLLFNGR